MKWKTAISTRAENELTIRGKHLSQLMSEHTYPEVVFLLLRGKLPSLPETRLMNMILVACAEHGVEAPSAFSARVSASVGNPLHVALAAGILATGEWHGGAIEGAAKLLQSEKSPEEIISDLRSRGARAPGFGHKLYKEKDPRAEALFAEAEQLGIAGTYVERARALTVELAKQSGKTLPLNIDGAIAALISELGFPPNLGNALFLLGRSAGILAHAHEEMENEKPYRRLDESDVTYTGN